VLLTIVGGMYLGAATAGPVAGRVLGMDVVASLGPPTTLGSSTNEDPVIVTRRDNIYLAETEPQIMMVKDANNAAGTLTSRLRVYRYVAAGVFKPAGVRIISGVGLVNPFLVVGGYQHRLRRPRARPRGSTYPSTPTPRSSTITGMIADDDLENDDAVAWRAGWEAGWRSALEPSSTPPGRWRRRTGSCGPHSTVHERAITVRRSGRPHASIGV